MGGGPARLWDTDSMLTVNVPHPWRFGAGCETIHRGAAALSSPWGDRHLCFQAVCAAGTFVCRLGAGARRCKARNGEAGVERTVGWGCAMPMGLRVGGGGFGGGGVRLQCGDRWGGSGECSLEARANLLPRLCGRRTLGCGGGGGGAGEGVALPRSSRG